MKKPKIAFIKQAVSPDLYTKTDGIIKELLKSSLLRSGPIDLIAQYDAKFYIVNECKTLPCKSWKESIFLGEDTKKAISKQYALAASPRIQKQVTDINDIPWEEIDIVISLNITIPGNIVKSRPNILWCYYILDPNLSYLISKKIAPFFRYNVFLNQNLSLEKISTKTHKKFLSYRKAVINFPYFYMSTKTFNTTFPPVKKAGIQLETRSLKHATKKQITTLKKFGPVTQRAPLIRYLGNLGKAKYFVVFPSTMGLFRGNSFIEAAAAGCLILAPEVVKVINKSMIF